jgi:hypothetical protein
VNFFSARIPSSYELSLFNADTTAYAVVSNADDVWAPEHLAQTVAPLDGSGSCTPVSR